MTKKALTIIAAVFFIVPVAFSQIYSPQLVGYSGVGNVFYPNGYYHGQLVNGIAAGVGTYYYRDGTIFQGYFENGYQNGPGVIVSYYGYVSGCWSYGQFVGNCVAVNNPYNSPQEVRDVITDASRDFSSEADFVATSPEGYSIERIDPSTSLGRQILGSYSSR